VPPIARGMIIYTPLHVRSILTLPPPTTVCLIDELIDKPHNMHRRGKLTQARQVCYVLIEY